jgi:DNA polymerase-3 subunit gamma/tau
VTIIDEVHMLSTGAFNALLKIMEEPPSYLVFILATTELHKVPETIASRCQVFNFKRITIHGIVEWLEYICKQE